MKDALCCPGPGEKTEQSGNTGGISYCDVISPETFSFSQREEGGQGDVGGAEEGIPKRYRSPTRYSCETSSPFVSPYATTPQRIGRTGPEEKPGDAKPRPLRASTQTWARARKGGGATFEPVSEGDRRSSLSLTSAP